MNTKYKSIVAFFILLATVSCKKDLLLPPYNGMINEEVVNTIEGLQSATIGTYNYIKDAYYVRNYHFFTEYASDNVSLSGTTTDPLFYAYNYQHQKNQANSEQFWRKAYQAIYGTNVVIEKVPQTEDAIRNQLLGENHYLRAMIHFDLVKVFGRPYTEDSGESLGVMIKTNTDVTELPPRSKVKDVYALVISDLNKAIELTNSSKNNTFASKEVAKALLSRVYLYMGNYEQAYALADEVIKSQRYALLSSVEYPKYFTKSPEENAETIFAIKHVLSDDRTWGSLGSMYWGGSSGYGEMYASLSYRNLLNKFPNDLRNSFVVAQYEKNADGSVKTDAQGKPVFQKRNGYEKHFISKYSFQNGYESLSSPVVLRLAEMYLNRAEAAFHLGKQAEALADVNVIRQRAGLSGAALFSTDNMMGYTSVLDVVLDERRLELAFESQRKFDVFRNKQTLYRNYPGTHLASGQTTQEIGYKDARVIFYIPEQDMVVNTNLVQNP